jgi:3-oxoacyl-[acyl-carrier protein] reductase
VLTGRNEDQLRARAAELDDAHPGRDSLAVPCDVTDEQQVQTMVAAAARRFGGIDILVNCAGGTGPIETPTRDYPAAEFRLILELNVIGTFLPCKYAIPHLIARGGGRIVNIAGTSGLRGYRNRSGYSSSKWAIRGLTRTLALELGPDGITVNDVCPNVTHGGRMDKIVAEKARVTGRPPSRYTRTSPLRPPSGGLLKSPMWLLRSGSWSPPGPGISPATIFPSTRAGTSDGCQPGRNEASWPPTD